MGTLSGQNSHVNSPPITSPFTVDERGLLTSRPWIRWLLQLYKSAAASYSSQSTGVFDPPPGRDIDPQIQQAAALAQETRGRDIGPEIFEVAELTRGPGPRSYAPELADLAALSASADVSRIADLSALEIGLAAADVSRIADLSALEIGLAAATVNRPGTDVQWFADTHANRLSLYPAAAYPTGSRFFETDRRILYINVAGVWKYAAGAMADVVANIPTGLTSDDAGLIFEVTDYAHRLKWSGSAWGWAPGDAGSGAIQGFLVDPSPTTGWHLCDGSAGVSYLKSDGTLGTVTLPDLVSASNKAAYLKFGSPASSTVNAATPPTFTGGSYTPAGTVSAPTFTGTPVTPTGSVGAPTFTGNSLTPAGNVSAPAFFGVTGTTSQDLGAGQVVQSGTGVTVAAHNGITVHEHNFTPAGSCSVPTFTGTPVTPTGSVSAPAFSGNPLTPAGSVSAPTFTGTPGTVSGTIGNTGEPQNLVLRPWFRQ